MYFDNEKKDITTLIEKKENESKSYNDQVKELETKVAQLKEARKNALFLGDDEMYIKTGGQIAVAESKLNRVKESINCVVNHETIQEIKYSICETYEKEIGKKISKIFKMCDDMFKNMDEIETIFSEMNETVRMYESLTGTTDIDFYRGDGSDIRGMREFMNKVIDPYTDNASGNSIRSFAFRLNYGK